MEDQAAREDACREYQSSLEDLTFNSKPHINMLTILAEENIQFAKDIVAIIEAQISKVFMIIFGFNHLLFKLFETSSRVSAWSETGSD
uniref:CID domain-containing protein n=1 Tax=Poecilia reticulata TaxID=8081 RepID=A0A3P9MY15_POERE